MSGLRKAFGDFTAVDGVDLDLAARFLLRAADGAVVCIVNRGYCHEGCDTSDLYDGDVRLAEAGSYFRTAQVFRTDAPAHLWLAGRSSLDSPGRRTGTSSSAVARSTDHRAAG
ncbi:DUF3237 family protein [Streptomyces humi]|uniref:DUF3237 family protein n=1 Tax=Streptomyces humi TaxID=1428620 RepID=UPI00069C4CE2|nr:DUF3237 family protein [Streptomyces humi]